MAYDTNVEMILLLLRRAHRNLNGVLIRTEQPVEMTSAVLKEYQHLVTELVNKLDHISSQAKEVERKQPVRRYTTNAKRKDENRLKKYGFIPKE